MSLVREPDAGNPPVRFDEREVETEHGMRLLRHKRGNPETEYVEAYPTAPPLDSTYQNVRWIATGVFGPVLRRRGLQRWPVARGGRP